MYKVHVVHGEPVYTEGLCSGLADRGMRITTQDGIGRGDLPWHADVFVVDLHIDSVSLLGVVGRAVLGAPVLLVGSPGHDELVARCVGLGASGFIDRRASFRSIELAILTVVSGRVFVGSDADRTPPSVAVGETKVLSTREYQVLQQIARGLTHSQIARRLQISQHTVDTYVKRIRGKLAVGNKAELTRAAVLSVGLHRPA